MAKTIVIGFLAAALCAAPLQAEPANPEASPLTRPNNDATLRAPHYYVPPAPHRTTPINETTPIIEPAPTDQPHR